MNTRRIKKQFTGKVSYRNQSEVSEIFFDDENIDVTEEIEKSLFEIKQILDIPDQEIEKAINSRKK